MTENGGSREIRAHWRVFLTRNPDARAVVNRAIARTGLTEDEVLFLLMDAWAAQHLAEDQQREFYGTTNQVTVN